MREPDDINNKTVFLWRQMSYQRVMLQHLLGTDEPGLLLLCYTPTPVPSNLINLRATVVMTSISVFIFFFRFANKNCLGEDDRNTTNEYTSYSLISL